MNKGFKYITPKKSPSLITEEKRLTSETGNISLYEAIAEIYEEMLDLSRENAELKELVFTLTEGGANGD